MNSRKEKMISLTRGTVAIKDAEDKLHDFYKKINENQKYYSLKEGIHEISKALSEDISLKVFDYNIEYDYCINQSRFDITLQICSIDMLDEEQRIFINFGLTNSQTELNELEEMMHVDEEEFLNKVKGYWTYNLVYEEWTRELSNVSKDEVMLIFTKKR